MHSEDALRHLKRQETIPELEEILQLSDGGEAYHWICSKMMKCVVGQKIWNKRYFKELLSAFSTVSDESFLVLTIENNYERWVDEANYLLTDAMDGEEDENWKENLAPAKYTNAGISAKNGQGSNRRYSGWSPGGHLRFNAIYNMVKEDRKRRANFELALKVQFQGEQGEDDGDSNSEAEEIIPANDMVGAKQPPAPPAPVATANPNDSEDEE
jgi:hypothetical protein